MPGAAGGSQHLQLSGDTHKGVITHATTFDPARGGDWMLERRLPTGPLARAAPELGAKSGCTMLTEGKGMKIHFLAGLALASLAGGQASSQVSGLSVSTTATQAILRYSSPADQACSLKVADMNRRVTIANGVQSGGVVSITTRAPHGLIPGSVVYIEAGVDGWNGWQTISAVPDTTSFSFPSGAAGSSTTGNVGVLIDDLNPNLFPGADQDSRPGNPNSGQFRVFVVGKRTADVAVDGNRYTRALQVNSRHRYTLTCGTQGSDADFTTQNLPLGDTHNDGLPVDRSRPGQYAYPTVQWTNRGQSLIDPVTGVRSIRATSPTETASTVQGFQTVIDSSGVWQTPSGPLSAGGTATFTGPCQSGDCALLLRADSLSLPGGATYTTGYGTGSSLDWLTVTLSAASTNNAACTPRSSAARRARLQTQAGSACNIVLCLTVNGVTCTSAEREVGLTTKPASYTVGSGLPIDLWQDSGAPAIARPDVSRASGTVNYVDATRQVTWASGNKFNSKWTRGSWIMVAGAEYPIESIQSELALTLAAPGPVGDLQQAPYSANNFGVLIRKKTATADQVSIGYTTFQYGSSGIPGWPAMSVQLCSPTAVAADGLSGYNCFSDRELYWVSADGADVRDLGYVATYPRRDTGGDLLWPAGYACGDSGYPHFDPLDGDTWYCLLPFYFSTDSRQAIVRAHYEGAHGAYTPGATIPDCDVSGGAQPCIRFTPMQPNKADAVSVAGPAFNPEYLVSGYTATYFMWGGVSLEGNIVIYTRQAAGNDTLGWTFVWDMGDRTPTGTGPNSMRIVAAASSYRHAPDTWCSIHSGFPAEGGWEFLSHNDLSTKSSTYLYTAALTSPLLKDTAGIAGGPDFCPANVFGVSGQNCTDITTSGEPTLIADGSYLQDVQVGDVIRVDTEYMRVVAKNDHTHLTLQRGYAGKRAPHSGTTLYMNCGLVTKLWGPGGAGIWDFRSDPYGLNADWTTILVDWNNVNGHNVYVPDGVHVNSVGMPSRIGETACPSDALGGAGANCYQIRIGSLRAIVGEPSSGVAVDPPFASTIGIGTANTVDSHPGPCLDGSWCLDSRPMNGGASDGVASMAGSSSTPFTPLAGQLWKLAGGGTVLKRKQLATMAYVGRSPLVDVSGPGSSIPIDATGSYTYCVALAAGECYSGSAANDVFVNAPFVSHGYCYYAGNAVQSDDTNSICIGPLGAYTGNLTQFGVSQQDTYGAYSRRLGPAFSRWNQQSVFWNMSMSPNGELGFSQVRWLDGVRSENLVTVLPPYPVIDSPSRNGFVPVTVAIPPQGAGSAIIVEFGYAENGPADSFFCVSRQETCVAASSSVSQTTPFYFAQSDRYSGVPCASGCTVAIPALPQRVVYYRWKGLDTSGAVTSISETWATVTP